MHDISMPFRSLLINGTVRLATCWTITRTDNVVFRFTDHDGIIQFGGNVYLPSGGSLTSSARQAREGLETSNFEVRGAITDDTITFDDLRTGRFKDAKVEEFIVDWKYPEAGMSNYTVYYIDSTDVTGELWVARMVGIASRLKVRSGDSYMKGCRWKKLGDADCALAGYAGMGVVGTVASVIDNRLQFTSTGGFATAPADHYSMGEFIWLTGPNTGQTHDVAKWLATANNIRLQLETYYPIVVGNTFRVFPGCNRTGERCKNLGNYPNFGGFEDIPGNDQLFNTPDAVKT